MRKLTDEEKLLVEENHNLIYWFMKNHEISVDEYYDVFAEELCKTVQCYDPSKSSLSNFYNIRCKNLLSNINKSNGYQKRSAVVIEFDDTSQHPIDSSDMGSLFAINDFINKDTTGILDLLVKGYTQHEIATMLNMSQSNVNRVLKKLRKEYLDSDR